MTAWIRIGVCVVGMLVLARPAFAQTCAGRIALGSGGVSGMAGAGLAFSSSATSFSGGALGGNSQMFGGANVGRISYDELDFSTTFVSGTVGGQVPVDANKRMSLCPVFSFGTEWASDIEGSGVDFSSTVFGGGVLFGVIVSETATVQVVPTFGVSIQRVNAKIEGFGEEESESDTVGVAQFGVGLVLHKMFAIVPAITVPFGVDDVEVGFSLQAVIGFGRR